MKKQSSLFVAGRKLSLSKKTVSNLSNSEMQKHVGGNPHTKDWGKNTCKVCSITCYCCIGMSY